MRPKKIVINIHEMMFNLIEESLLFSSVMILRNRMLSEFFNEVLSVTLHILKLSIFISLSALGAWSRILLWEGLVKGLPVLMEIPLWTAMRASRWREVSLIYVEEHCPQLSL